MRRRLSHASRAAVVIALLTSRAVLLASAPRIDLVPLDPWTFAVEVTSDQPYLGGELGLAFPGAKLTFEGIEPGADFPEGEDFDFPGGFELLDAREADPAGCTLDSELESGLVVYWIHPRSPETEEILPLPAETRRVLVLRFARTAGAEEPECHDLKFVACLGDSGAPVENLLTGLEGASVPAATSDLTVCTDPCRVLRFASEQSAACETLVVEVVVEAGGIQRRVPAAGLLGADLAEALFCAFRDAPGLVVGLSGSAVSFCATEGDIAPAVSVEADPPERNGRRELPPGAVLGPCGIDVSGDVPRCPDRDRDGRCDTDDPRPGEYDPEAACTAPPPCPGAGDADGDGVCDDTDNCPEHFNPSQADTDGDCIGDACQSGTEPFVPADLCFREPLAPLEPDEVHSWDFTFERCERAACISFTAPPGGPVLLTLEALAGEGAANRYALYLKLGAPAGPFAFDETASGPGDDPLRLALASAAAGNYFVRLQALALPDEPVSLRLMARAPALDLESISPATGAAGRPARTVIRGGGFDRATRFALVPAGGSEEIPGEALVLAPGRAEVVFDLTGVPAPQGEGSSRYHLAAREPGLEAALESAFRVVAPGVRGFEIRLLGRSRYRRGVLSLLTLRVKNLGPGEATAPLFKIRAPAHTALRLARDELLRGPELLVLATDPGGFAGRLAPGAVAEIPVLFVNTDPDCRSCPATFTAELFTPLPGDFVAWGTLPAPEGIDEDTWQEAQEALPEILGWTWSEVVERLAEIATRLARRGTDAASVRELFRFAVRQALGRPSAAAAGRVVEEATLLPLRAVTVVAREGDKIVSHAVTDSRGGFAIDWLEHSRPYRLDVLGREGHRDIEIEPPGDLHDQEIRVGAERADDGEPRCSNCDERSLPEAALFPPAGLFTPAARLDTRFVATQDPNEKSGPDGEREEGFLCEGAEVIFAIHTENLAAAEIPVQRVTIIDTLDPGLDWTSVRLLDVSVGGRLMPLGIFGEERLSGFRTSGQDLFAIAARGRDFFGSCLESEPGTQVDFGARAAVNATAGTIRWDLEALDCEGNPIQPDSLEGFLPPNVTPPEGEISVSFSARPRGDLAADADIFNHAEIRFDAEASVRTNEVRNRVTAFLRAGRPAGPRPADDPEGLRPAPLDTALRWEPAACTARYDLSFWQDGEPAPEAPSLVDLAEAGAAPPFALEPGARYHWQVFARTARGVATAGPVWSFVTAGEAPPCPRAPGGLEAEGGCPPGIPVVLRWEEVEGARAYAVFTARRGEALEQRVRAIESEVTLPGALVRRLGPGEHEWAVVALNESCPEPDPERMGPRGSFRLGPWFVRADVDQSGTVNLTDGVQVLLHLFNAAGLPAPLKCLDAADADDSGGLNLTDGVSVFLFLFRGRSVPAPSPEATATTTAADPEDCGLDPTDDALECESPPAYCQ